MKYKRSLLLALLLILPIMGRAQSNDTALSIKKFYTAYAQAVANGEDQKLVALKKAHLTPAMIAKAERLMSATDGDAIIRAQDFDKDVLSTIKVKPLDADWYMVTYHNKWENTDVNIPLKTTEVNGKTLICYITPLWHNDKHGDQLLYKEKEIPQTVDNSSPEALIRTFYTAYMSTYAAMPEGLNAKLQALRQKALTPKAIKAIATATGEVELPGYDLVIDDFDFDPLWIPTMQIKKEDEGLYTLTYTKWDDNITHLFLTITEEGGTHLIDEIEIDAQSTEPDF